MKRIEIDAQTGKSEILVGESIDNLKDYIKDRKAVIITDNVVYELYRDRFPKLPLITIGTGEMIKTMDTVLYILNEMTKLDVDRKTLVIGIGGGIVTDIVGFAASIYMRGVPFGFVSTTLLSQVDASCGGKNGVNLSGYKNMIGVFNQPEFVICDTDLLKTLPQTQVSCGFAEIIKHAAIYDEDMFRLLYEKKNEALILKKDIIDRLVYDSVCIKADVVRKDERESGERKKLNFGHTFGHAVEKATGLNHGEAIGIGMVIAAKASKINGAESVSDLIKSYGLPVKTDKISGIKEALSKDKKRVNASIDFVYLKKIGEAYVKETPLNEVESFLGYM